MTPEASVGGFILLKKYFFVTLVAFFGGLAHAIETVKRQGWRGWVSFWSDVVVCIFFGHIFFQVSQIVNPEYHVLFTSLGAFWGVKSFDYLKGWFIKSLQANLPK